MAFIAEVRSKKGTAKIVLVLGPARPNRNTQAMPLFPEAPTLMRLRFQNLPV